MAGQDRQADGTASPPALRPARPVAVTPGGWKRLAGWCRGYRVDIAWVAFVGLNLAAMRLLPEWQTVPFLAIWVSLTAIYGFRLWRLQSTMLTLAAVTFTTGGIIAVQVVRGKQDADYLAEVPLIALMFLVMVWHGRRRLAATAERLAALEEVHRVSQENLRLLTQQRQFLQDASHELGTPITVALGHAELIERATAGNEVARDARVVAEELQRLRRLATRMLLLASAGSPGFLRLAPVSAATVAEDALERWGHTPRQWRLGTVEDAAIQGDPDRLALALDALLENAIAHTAPGDRIEISARRQDGQVVLSVADSGDGISAAGVQRIFERLGRSGQPRAREGGFGLGLAIVQAIADAHQGSARMHSTLGSGSTFEIVLPASPVPPGLPGPVPPAPVPPALAHDGAGLPVLVLPRTRTGRPAAGQSLPSSVWIAGAVQTLPGLFPVIVQMAAVM